MKYKISTIALAAAMLASCGEAEKKAEGAGLTSGVETKWLSETIRPQDDFNKYVNAKWAAETEMPGDMTRWGGFTTLRASTEEQVKTIVDEIGASVGAEGELGQLQRLYASFVDTEGRESAGMEPIKVLLAEIEAAESKQDILLLTAKLRRDGVSSFFSMYVGVNRKDSNEHMVSISQAGIGLPDKGYYTREGEKFDKIRSAYPDYIADLLAMGGVESASEKAAAIYAMEVKFAEIQWTREESRNRDKTYNPTAVADLNANYDAGFDWVAYLDAAGMGAAETLNITQPSFFEDISSVIEATDASTLKAYLQYRAIRSAENALTKALYDVNFDFQSALMRGQKEQPVQWKQAVRLLNGTLGEAVGKVYVDRYFPVEAKTRMVSLVDNLVGSFGDAIEGLDWMSPVTKEKAQAKRLKFTTKIGYPDVWKDYSAMDIKADDLYGNLISSNNWDYDDNVGRLSGPVDRTRWGMSPQTVNAYHNPSMNEIVFPAAILQPPFFDLKADDAINYGSIGAVIGHEIGHAFDDQGRKFDPDGNMNDWWTDADAKAFDVKADMLVAQYDAFEVLPELFVRGRYTLGENIGDLTGATIAYKAYRKSLGDKEAPVIDGLTGDERFFLGWGQVWRRIQTEETSRNQVMTDPHSPANFRVIGPLRNVEAFYKVYDVKEGDGMYLPPEERVKIW